MGHPILYNEAILKKMSPYGGIFYAGDLQRKTGKAGFSY